MASFGCECGMWGRIATTGPGSFGLGLMIFCPWMVGFPHSAAHTIKLAFLRGWLHCIANISRESENHQIWLDEWLNSWGSAGPSPRHLRPDQTRPDHDGAPDSSDTDKKKLRCLTEKRVEGKKKIKNLRHDKQFEAPRKKNYGLMISGIILRLTIQIPGGSWCP